MSTPKVLAVYNRRDRYSGEVRNRLATSNLSATWSRPQTFEKRPLKAVMVEIHAKVMQERRSISKAGSMAYLVSFFKHECRAEDCPFFLD